MAEIRIAGVDWATEAKKRAMVELVVAAGAPDVKDVRSPLSDAEMIKVLSDDGLEVVAVDTPFGWPRLFVDFVRKWSVTGSTAPPPDSRVFRYRATDLVVWNELGKQPLSVSSDRIALSTRSWTMLAASENLSARIDAGGDRQGKATTASIIEVYPGASLVAFAGSADGKKRHLVADGYKADRAVRMALLVVLFEMFAIGNTSRIDELVGGADNESDCTDAFLAALTALAYLGELPGWKVRRPALNEVSDAKSEGWIFFPVRAT